MTLIEIKVSIIVAVYNTAQYLEKCIESLINQTLKNIEIILVDDGSKDNSSDICNYYAKSDKRIKYIYQKNSGPSVARNRGISISKGKYIAFVDSDDYVEKDMYQILYNNAEKYESDIVICNFFRDWPNGEIERSVIKIKDTFVNTDEIGMVNYFSRYWIGLKYANYICNKLYRKDLFALNNIKFPENLKFIEDRMLHYMLLPYIKKTLYINYDSYHYVQRSSSASYTQGKKENLVSHYINVYTKTLEIWAKTGLDKELKSIYPAFMCRMIQGSIYTTRQANSSIDYISSMVTQAIRDNKIAQKQLWLAAFGSSITTYRRAVGLNIGEEFKMRGFVISCLLGKTTFKGWQKFYNKFLV